MASQIYCLVIFAVFVSIETTSATDELYENGKIKLQAHQGNELESGRHLISAPCEVYFDMCIVHSEDSSS